MRLSKNLNRCYVAAGCGSRRRLLAARCARIMCDEAATYKTSGPAAMHPFIIRDEPGLCPICNMELTPLKPGTAAATGERQVKHWHRRWIRPNVRESRGRLHGHDWCLIWRVRIAVDPVTQQSMGVRTVPVEVRDLQRSCRASVWWLSIESSQYVVNSKSEGWIERLHVQPDGATGPQGASRC